MEKIHPSTVHRSFHSEISAHTHIVCKATLLNMLDKQQGQFSRNLSSSRNGYFRGQDRTPKKNHLPRGEGPISVDGTVSLH